MDAGLIELRDRAMNIYQAEIAIYCRINTCPKDADIIRFGFVSNS